MCESLHFTRAATRSNNRCTQSLEIGINSQRPRSQLALRVSRPVKTVHADATSDRAHCVYFYNSRSESTCRVRP